MWDDAKIGIRHLAAHEKVAVVSDVSWVVNAVKYFYHYPMSGIKGVGQGRVYAE